MKSSFIHIIFLSFIALSSTVSSQPSDSCASKLSVTHLIPFNTSSLNCLPAWSSEGFILRYSKSGPSLWSYILSAPDTGSYIAIGFSGDGGMVGSSAVAGWITSSGPGIVKQYYLGGTKSGECPPDQGSLKLTPENSMIVSQTSRIYLAFQLDVVQPPPYLIYAVGPNNKLPASDSYLIQHRNKASTSINYITGVSADAGAAPSTGAARRHGLLVMLGWGVLMPVGVGVARYCKRWDPHWFYAHISIQGIGFVLGLAGVIEGFKLDGGDGDDVVAHKSLGICILIFGCLQVMAFLVRPGKESKVRKYWNWYHYYIGRATIACAIGNIFFGLSLAQEATSWSVGYGVFLAIWVVVCIVLEVRMCMINY